MKNRLLQKIIAALMMGMVLINGCASQGQNALGSQPATSIVNTAGQAQDTPTPFRLPATLDITMEGSSALSSTEQSKSPKPLLRLQQQAADPAFQPSLTATPESLRLLPENWKEWPERPVVSSHLREIYQQGLSEGNDPHAFSILGDCQSQPPVFMGVFDSDSALVKSLPASLQDTVQQFSGSFNRYSPTVKDGTTEGALLWAQWNDNKEKKCQRGETPLDCELRVHKPSIVFIHIGTHWEARNRHYLTLIIDKVLEQHAVPVLVTKADNREKDERVNQNLASLADEYNLPLWNFWGTVQHLPHNGLKTGSDTYLSDEGVEIHRMGALKALDAVWTAVR